MCKQIKDNLLLAFNYTFPNLFFFCIKFQKKKIIVKTRKTFAGADLGGGCRGCASPPPEMTCGFLIQLVFCKKKNKTKQNKKTMWFIGVEVEQETSAPPPKKNPGSAVGL